MPNPRMIGYFEEYACGCVSDTEKRRKDLLGYCATHGADRRAVFKQWALNRKKPARKKTPCPPRAT
jgi:hypothetical protein